MDAEGAAEAWRRNQAIDLVLLDAIPEAGLDARYAPRTRSVRQQFAHLHNVRVYHLEQRPKLLGDLRSFPRGAEPAREEVRAALVGSAAGIEAFLVACVAAGKVPSWRGSPATWLSYFVAHEAHHRGLALAALRVSGVKVPRELVYGLWSSWNPPAGGGGEGRGKAR